MTICIATICSDKENECIVFATDHMVSTGSGQFEHSIVKYELLNRSTVAMLAGHALLFEDLTKGDFRDGSTFEEIKTAVFQNFFNKRWEIVQNEILSLYGVGTDFFLNALEREIPNPYVQTILEKVSAFRMQTQILLTGFEGSRALIAEVNEQNHVDFRRMNFHCIGSGSQQAQNTLLFQRQSKSDGLPVTLFNVYKAKRNAEVMEGVGRETELMVLTQDRGLLPVNEKQLKTLEIIYEEELNYGKTHGGLAKLLR